MNWLCIFIFCSQAKYPNPSHCDYFLGEPKQEQTDKLVDYAVKGSSYSVCGRKQDVERHEFYRAMKGK